jgi:hypothetical protein
MKEQFGADSKSLSNTALLRRTVHIGRLLHSLITDSNDMKRTMGLHQEKNAKKHNTVVSAKRTIGGFSAAPSPHLKKTKCGKMGNVFVVRERTMNARRRRTPS